VKLPQLPQVRIHTLALALSLLLMAQPWQLAAQQWKTYSFPGDGFSILFPAEPDQTTKDLETKRGKIEVRSYATQDGPAALLVGVTYFANSPSDTDAVLEAGKSGVLTSANARLIGENKIELGTNHGLEFTAESDTAQLTVRIYWINGATYQIVVVSPGKKPYADAQKFFDSFQLASHNGK
jgi:hypothetical protein